ncbi:hypothetical protein ACO0QE_003579 [Hanseniaspora vineae]
MVDEIQQLQPFDAELFYAGRRSTKKVNYNEKKVDAELEQSLKESKKQKKSMSPASSSNSKKSLGSSGNNGSSRKSQNENKVSKPKTSSTKSSSTKKSAQNGSKSGASNKDAKKVTDNYVNKIISDKSVPWNFIPSLPAAYRKQNRFSTTLPLEDAMVDVAKQILYIPGGKNYKMEILLSINEHIYMVSEPPGEPYYVGRVVSFVPKKNYHTRINNCTGTNIFPAAYFNVKMNWYYRQRDISDSIYKSGPRILFGSLHTDVCPLHSFRGRCTVMHKNEATEQFGSISEYITKSNYFYFDQVFDRYTGEYYNVHSTQSLLETLKPNPSSKQQSHYLKLLAMTYPYIYCEPKFPLHNFIEKYLLNHQVADSNKYDQIWDLRCGECWEWCQNTGQHIQCEGCGQPYHLYCLNPPLERKPNRDVVWVCSDCISKDNFHFEEVNSEGKSLPPFKSKVPSGDLEDFAKQFINSVSLKKKKLNKDNWWFQYFGTFTVNNLESCVTFDCPYPFKTNRLGVSKYQYKFPEESSAVGKNLVSNESTAFSTLSQEKNDGILERGTDETVSVLWRWNENDLDEGTLDKYMLNCIATFPKDRNFSPTDSNFRDFLCKALMENNFDVAKAYQQCDEQLSRKRLEIPTFTDQELSVFEREVAKYGSELKPVCKAIETQPMAMVVKFFYLWKKTERGLKVRNKWEKKLKAANLEKNPNLSKEWKYIDDSSVELDSLPKETEISCSFCLTDFSPMWYKITGCSTKPDQKENSETLHLQSLCIRCARLWRRYGVRWESPSSTLKAVYGGNSSTFKANVAELLSDTAELQHDVKVTASLAYQKKIEWELILDSELIIKQRESIFLDHNRAAKYKKNLSNLRSTMSKSLTQLVDNSLTNDDFMSKKLEKYLCKFEKKKNESKSASTKVQATNGKPASTSSKLQAANEKEATALPTSRATNEKGPFVPNKKNAEISGVSTKSVSKPAKKTPARLVSNDSFANTTGLFNKKSTVLKVNCTLPNNENCELLIDPDFKTVSIANFAHLFKDYTERKTESDLLKIPDTLKVQRSFDDLGLHFTNKLDENNVPVLLNDSKEKILQVLHQHALKVLEKAQVPVTSPKKTRSKKGGYRQTIASKSASSSIKLRDFCSVCMGHMSPDELQAEEIICNNCGMNCHYYCYGKSKELVGNTWLCDPCSNDVQTIASQDYRCCLCVSKEIDYDACRKLLDVAIPDALKRTDNNKWAHVICALYQPGVSVGHPSLQPLQHIKHICKSLKCSICSNTSGSVIKCEFCENRFHVTCAQDEETFQLGFTSEEALQPVLVCSLHSGTRLKPLDFKLADGKTLWRKYLESVVQRHITSSDVKSLKEEESRQCPKCGTTESIYWYADNVCRGCYIDELYPDARPKILSPDFADYQNTEIKEQKENKEKFLENIDLTKFQSQFMRNKIKANNKRLSMEHSEQKQSKKVKH